MAQPAIQVHNREFWTNYVRTAEAEAAKALNRPINEELYNREKNANRIDARHRPTIANYDPIIPPNFNFWIWNWGSSTPAPAAPQSEEERARAAAAQAAVVGSIIAIVGTFLATYTYKKYTRQAEASQRSHALLTAINEQRWSRNDPLLMDIERLVGSQVQIDDLNSARIQKYALSAFVLLAGGVALAAGGFAAIPALMTVGKIVLLVSALIAAATLGWHWNDNEELERHYESIAVRIRVNGQPPSSCAERILRDLPGRQADEIRLMNLPNGAPATYQYEPLFPVLNADGLPQWVFRAPGPAINIAV